jgi:hypothetical protein
MIRNLKILVAAAMALAALGAISASGAQAAEGHCSVENCKVTVLPDGTPGSAGKTAHQVFIVKQGVKSVSTTCQKVEGNGTVATKTFKTIQLGSLAYSNCDVAGAASTVKTNGCEYHFETPGVAPHDAKVKVVCPAGKVIEIEVPATGCKFAIGSTAVLGGGVKFHDAETGGVKKELVTAEVTVNTIPAEMVSATGTCPGELTKGAVTGEYTTGNVELTGGTAAGVMGTLWWE